MRQLIRLTIIFAVLALPVTATANTYWFYGATTAEKRVIPAGETVVDPAFGKLKLTVRRVKAPSVRLVCEASGTEAFWNGMTNGEDETRSIAFTCTGEIAKAPCEPTVTPTLPWGSLLGFSETWPLPDPWSNMALDVACSGIDYGRFTGTLTPATGDGDEQNGHDEPDSSVIFHPLTAGRLDGPEGSNLSFLGIYHFGLSRGHEVVTGETALP